MLILKRKIDESIIINNDIEIKILNVDNNVVKLGIKAPKGVVINRKEIFESIINSNKEAAVVAGDKLTSLLEVFKVTK